MVLGYFEIFKNKKIYKYIITDGPDGGDKDWAHQVKSWYFII
jgi:hypothetical protein